MRIEKVADVTNTKRMPEGVEDLYVRHAPAMVRLAFLLTRDAAFAEDDDRASDRVGDLLFRQILVEAEDHDRAKLTSLPNGQMQISATGSTPQLVTAGRGGFGYFDTPQGTYYYGTTAPMTKRVDVVASDGIVYRGKWMRASGKGDRVWLVALPGSGHGFVLQGRGTPMAIAWPTARGAALGSVVTAGTNPSGTSFWLGVPDPSPGPYCLALQTLQGATTQCLSPGSGSEVLSDFVTSGDSTIAALRVPSDITYVEAKTAGGSLVGGGSCDAPPAPAPAEWSGRMVCPLWLFQRSGTATLRFFDGSGGGAMKDWPQSHPPMQLAWGSGTFSLRP